MLDIATDSGRLITVIAQLFTSPNMHTCGTLPL